MDGLFLIELSNKQTLLSSSSAAYWTEGENSLIKTLKTYVLLTFGNFLNCLYTLYSCTVYLPVVRFYIFVC